MEISLSVSLSLSLSYTHTHTHTHTHIHMASIRLALSQRVAKSLPERRTINNTNPGLVVLGDGWNYVKLVKI